MTNLSIPNYLIYIDFRLHTFRLKTESMQPQLGIFPNRGYYKPANRRRNIPKCFRYVCFSSDSKTVIDVTKHLIYNKLQY